MSSPDQPEDQDEQEVDSTSIFDEGDDWDVATPAKGLANEEVEALFRSTESSENEVDFSDFELDDMPTRVGFTDEPEAESAPAAPALPLGILGDAPSARHEDAPRRSRERHESGTVPTTAVRTEGSLFSRVAALFKRTGAD